MSAAVENLALRPHAAAELRLEKLATAAERANSILRAELLDAILHNPQVLIQTPGWYDETNPKTISHAASTASDVIRDMLYGEQGDELMLDLLRMWGMCAQGMTAGAKQIAQTRLRAVMAEHAAFHEEDLVRHLEGEA